MVKARSELMDGIAEQNAPLDRWFLEIGCKRRLAPIRVIVERHKLRGIYRAVTMQDCGLKVSEVFFGPICFQPDSAQRWGHSGYLPVGNRARRGENLNT